MVQHRFIMIAYSAQSHINPSLQLAKRLIHTTGSHVTFLTTVSTHRHIDSGLTTLSGLTIAPFSDGYDNGTKPKDDREHVRSELKRRSSQAIRDHVRSGADEGNPYTCIVYTLTLTWVLEVATELHLPSAMAWIQPATVLDIYYYYFHGYKDVFMNSSTGDASFAVELPGLPLLLKSHDLPSFLLASNPYSFLLSDTEHHFEKLGELIISKPIILVNTFEALEPEALKAIDSYKLIAVGPLIPSAFLDDKYSSDKSFGCDFFQKANDSECMEWLNSKPKQSVVYISFGSISVLSKIQMEELARGLVDSGRPFLWVIRENQRIGEGKEEEEELSCRAELEELGMIVPWCSQLEILSNPSLGCFVTHCGWSSSLESLVSGVPVVTFPQWTDQCTNAKLIEETWKTGVRVIPNEEGVVMGEELKRCIDLVMGNEELRRNAMKWKELARVAVSDGGSSEKNLKAFVEEIEDGLC